MKKTIKKAFTLIELLVVITIIWILATGATSVYTSQIQKARDSTRINDIKALQGSIEQFYQDESVYPQWWVDWIGDLTSVKIYMPNLAEDPKHDQTCNGSRCGYVYDVWDDDNWIEQWSYEISTAFENSWNISNKANGSVDNWTDDNRYELWVDTNGRDTEVAQGDDISTGQDLVSTDVNTKKIVIKNSSVAAAAAADAADAAADAAGDDTDDDN